MFGYIEKLEEEVFKEFEGIDKLGSTGFASEEEENHFIDNFIKNMELRASEEEIVENLKMSSLENILRLWLESDE